jgi:hypothetical protein
MSIASFTDKFFNSTPSPFLTDVSKQAVDPDMVAACWRFIGRVYPPPENSAQGLILSYLAELIDVDEAHRSALRKTVKNFAADYKDFDGVFPGYGYLATYNANSSLRTNVQALPRQIVYEADNYGLDPYTYKGCLIAWVITEQNVSDYSMQKLKRAIGYNGKPIFFVGSKSYAVKPYQRVKAGGNRKRMRSARSGWAGKARRKNKFKSESLEYEGYKYPEMPEISSNAVFGSSWKPEGWLDPSTIPTGMAPPLTPRGRSRTPRSSRSSKSSRASSRAASATPEAYRGLTMAQKISKYFTGGGKM